MKEQLQTSTNMIPHDLGTVPTPLELQQQFALTAAGQAAVLAHRKELTDIMHTPNSRMLVVVGPCSLDADMIDGQFAAKVFADQLFEASEKHGLEEELKLVLRMPPTKPRTANGWSGLEQTDMPKAAQILTDLANDGRPLAMEVMEERHFARFGDRLSLGWVGARNVGNTLLRHTVSAHPELPTFFKNSMEEDVRSSLLTAHDASMTAAGSHPVEVMSADGSLVKVMSPGNPNTGIIFRGNAQSNPRNFKFGVWDALNIRQPIPPLMIDISHENARAHGFMHPGGGKIDMVAGQIACFNSLTEEIEVDHVPKGVMIESNLIEGQGNLPGQSKTDPCIGIGRTIELLSSLARVVHDRRVMNSVITNRKLW